MSERGSVRWRRWSSYLPIVGVCVGVALIYLSHSWALLTAIHAVSLTVAELGIAIVVASILGGTLEWIFHQRLVEDAFKASVGYILPEVLKGEMDWIYGQKIICIEHQQTYTLTSTSEDADTLVMHVWMERTFENVSQSSQPFTPHIEIDEWFHKSGTSNLIEFGYQIAGEKGDRVSNKNIGLRSKKDNERPVIQYKADVKILPAQKLIVWQAFEEIKRKNDSAIISFMYTTKEPSVVVKRDVNELGISLEFSHRQQLELEEHATDTYKLPATLLPGQIIELRWWKKEDAKRWVKA